MSFTIERNQPKSDPGDATILATDTLTTTGPSDPVRLSGDIVVQLSGTATNITAVFERNPQDPAQAPNGWAPAETEAFSGNLSLGIPARRYQDPISAFYRLRVTALSGGNVTVAISAQQA